MKTGAYVTVLTEDGTLTEYWLEPSGEAVAAVRRALNLWTVASETHERDLWGNTRTI